MVFPLLPCWLSLALTSYAVVHYLRTTPRFDVKKVSVAGLKRVEDDAGVRAGGPARFRTISFRSISTTFANASKDSAGCAYATVQRVLPDKISSRWSNVSPSAWREFAARFISLMRRPSCLIRIRGSGSISRYLDGLESDEPEGNPEEDRSLPQGHGRPAWAERTLRNPRQRCRRSFRCVG